MVEVEVQLLDHNKLATLKKNLKEKRKKEKQLLN